MQGIRSTAGHPDPESSGNRTKPWEVRRRTSVAACIAGLTLFLASTVAAAESQTAARAINEFGLDLYRRMSTTNANLCLSPYSIQNALAMTYAGADGKTRSEMATALRYPSDDVALHGSFFELGRALDEIADRTARMAESAKARGTLQEPIVFTLANRLFGQKGIEFRAPFLLLVKDRYGAPLEALDFGKNPEAARIHINGWVEDRTRKRIRDLIPAGAIDGGTRLVLANALYLKAPWSGEFPVSATKPEPFRIRGKASAMVPTMRQKRDLGHAKRPGHTVLTLAYADSQLQFVILLPDAPDGLDALEKQLTPALLAGCARTERRDVVVHLPKFRLESASMSLVPPLSSMGMKSAFGGDADFGRMSQGGGFAISDVIHKTFFAIDEKGTEAAAATAVVMSVSAREPKPPIEVRVDRPFVFAIQHTGSGACLFLGHVVDPR